jgi:hypothetical protein
LIAGEPVTDVKGLFFVVKMESFSIRRRQKEIEDAHQLIWKAA